MKTGSFVSAIITFLLSVLMSFVCYNFADGVNFNATGWESLTLVVSIPILIIVYLILAALLLATFINLLRAVTSDSKPIKIISIILIIAEVVMIGINLIPLLPVID